MIYVLIKTLIFRRILQASSLMIMMLFFGWMSIDFCRYLGEYVGRIFGNKDRPLYLLVINISLKVKLKEKKVNEGY